jgi:transcriptional regulator with XRE-family HTH domain
MANSEFVRRLDLIFEGATMAVVAKRLGVPHATVRNYYHGRLPAPEVLIKIAATTGVSLNWLLLGNGDMFAGEVGPVGLGRFLELKIGELVDRRLEARLGPHAVTSAIRAAGGDFDLVTAVGEADDPQLVMRKWFAHEGREYPMDYGVVFFRGWRSFSADEKVNALKDAKKVLDKVLGA